MKLTYFYTLCAYAVFLVTAIPFGDTDFSNVPISKVLEVLDIHQIVAKPFGDVNLQDNYRLHRLIREIRLRNTQSDPIIKQGQLNTEEEANLYRVSMERFFPRVESVLTGRLRPLVYFETVLDFVVMHALFKPEAEMTDDDKKAIEHLSERIVQNGQDSFQVIQQLIDSHPINEVTKQSLNQKVHSILGEYHASLNADGLGYSDLTELRTLPRIAADSAQPPVEGAPPTQEGRDGKTGGNFEAIER